MKKLKFGMVGGGEGAFIGAVHRAAAALTGQMELVCGAFSRNHDNTLHTGAQLGLPAERCYASWQAMFAAEQQRGADAMDFVVIVTPNHLHFPVAQAALEAGFHVMSDKPATFSLEEAKRLRETLSSTTLHYGLTHTYAGYPMVMEARQRIAQGELGTVKKVVVDYSQGWLADPTAQGDSKQAGWRLDPEQAGASCCMGDIGVHAAHLAEHVCGLQIEQLCAELSTAHPGRALDDDGMVLLRFTNGARGMLNASQISVGEENNLSLRVYGERGGLVWRQEEPNTLHLKWPDKPAELVRTGWPYVGTQGSAHTRLPAGHPEGYLEAFANLYAAFATQLVGQAQPGDFVCPGIDEAVRGMAFIEATVASSAQNAAWLTLA